MSQSLSARWSLNRIVLFGGFRWLGLLNNIDDDKRNVILLVHCNRPPPLEFGEYLTQQLRGGLQSIIAYDTFQLLVAEWLPCDVLRFGHAVGIEQQAIGWFKRHVTHRICRVRFDSEQQPVRFDTLDFAFRISPAQKRRMSRSGIERVAVLSNCLAPVNSYC